MKYRYNRKLFLVAAMLLTGGVAMAQSGGDEPTPTPTPTPGVVIKGNVYGGCEIGNVTKDTYVQMNGGTMEGSVYGGGMGSTENERQGEVLGNATVKMTGGTVERSIYGGGMMGSVGTFTAYDTFIYQGSGGAPNDTVLVPKACQAGTGLVQVLMEGGHVGLYGSNMPDAESDPDDDDRGWIFTGCQGEADSITYHRAIALGVVDSTYLEIKGGVITASVYGGCENGLVLRSTNVKIEGGQIGTGYIGFNNNEHHWDEAYTEEQWTAAKNAVTGGTVGTSSYVNPFHECDAWPYVAPYNVFDYYYDSAYIDGSGIYQPANSANVGTNGQTFFGKVFGGGSGFYPIAPGIWRRTAGQVRKDTWVEITGGHILTSIYGGNEVTDVLGTAHVKMTGGTLGVPRDSASIVRHPVTCYLFGAGMGDPRVLFNTWTNVENVDVEVSGDAFVFGSVFGGGEEGHVLSDVDLTIKGNAHIGTLGYSYVEGNVFGGGRGFSGEALTAGTVGGNVTVNIEGGTMLGSIYGGGRLASVGTFFTDPESDEYGQFQDGLGHGFVTVNISGGTIGNSHECLDHPEDHTKGCNVFGGSMGRITLMDGTTENHLWPRLAQVKQAKVNITQNENSVLTIRGNVYGGSEFGSVRDSAIVILDNPDATIHKIFGGGYGSSTILPTPQNDSTAQPAALAGRVIGNTLVNVKQGKVQIGVYGGGEYASVGREKDDVLIAGNTNVIVSGGTIGDKTMYATYDTHNTIDEMGHVFGGSQGAHNDPTEALKEYCNVNHTRVDVKGGRIYGSVFGGGADSHVLGNTEVYIHSNDTIGNTGMTSWDGNVFGGGKGNGRMVDGKFVVYKTMGRVGGNTYVSIDTCRLMGSVFGGGRTGLTGVDVDGVASSFLEGQVYDSTNHGLATIEVSGKTSGSGDNITYSTNIGTSIADNLFNSDESVGDIYGGGKGDTDFFDDIWAGRTANNSITVTGSPRIYGGVFGGGEQSGVGYYQSIAEDGVDCGQFYESTGSTLVTLGTEHGDDNPVIGTEHEFEIETNAWPWTIYDTINNLVKLRHTCTGNVFGGGQGDVTPGKTNWVTMARARTTTVNVHGGTIMGCVHGGGEQGTVMEDTHVNVTGGTIGAARTLHYYGTNTPTSDLTTYYFGSVYGGGYGDKSIAQQTNDSSNVVGVGLAGRVYGNTYVNITGGHICENVFGGGDLASVGYVKNGNLVNGHCYVSVSGSAVVGPIDGTGMNGYVFGAGRGVGNDPRGLYNPYCDVNSTEVICSLNETGSVGHVYGSLYGGGSDSHVLGNTSVTLNSGIIGTYNDAASSITDYGGNIFGGGRNFLRKNYAAGRVMGNTHVVMNGGTALASVFGGGRMGSVGVGETGQTILTDDTHGKTLVEIKGGTIGCREIMPTYTKRTIGDVYGGGKGTMEGLDTPGHPAAASLLISISKDTEIRISEANPNVPTIIYGSVYGGGEVANVGRFTWTQDSETLAISNIQLVSDGNTKITVSGGRIGADLMQMRPDIAEGTDNYDLKYNDDVGHVYGGGEGRSINPNDHSLSPIVDAEGNSLVDLMATVDSTDVTISGGWVKGSVYGGAAMGHVRGDSKVTVSGGQIGAGYYPAVGNIPAKDSLYAVEKFFNPVTYFTTHNTSHDIADADTLKECVSWDYDPTTNRFFDPVALKADADQVNYNNSKPTNGHSWFGNVYGGGSGYYPYIRRNHDSTADSAVWNPESGRVWGNSSVTITGGHILTNVYGGGEVADIGTLAQSGGYVANTGKAVVKMSDGTVGVPRKDEQIERDPFSSNLFGAGRGDARSSFNAVSNVTVDSVIISGKAIVYGSVFGGAEVGHVIDSTNVFVKNEGGDAPVIGTTGFSGYDGHVFGGGWGHRAFVAENSNWAAGRVGGNAHVKMTDGTVLGNLYGGGFVARVGVGENGGFDSFVTVTIVDNDTSHVYQSQHHGLAKVDISGGYVGNNAGDGHLLLMSDEKVGNVYGGGRGDPTEHIEDDFGRVGNSVANVSGSPHIYGSVFGGGQMANSGHWNNYSSWYTTGTSKTQANISGSPIIGTAREFTYEYSSDPVNVPQYTEYDTINGMKLMAHSRTGSVYGGGQGDVILKNGHPQGFEQGHSGSAEVRIEDTPTIMSSVFGGSDQGVVWGDTKVTISGGTIGTTNIPYDSLTYNEQGAVTASHHNRKYSHGSVYGGSFGLDAYKNMDLQTVPDGHLENVIDSINSLTGCVYGNTEVNIEGGTISGNVFGGGDMADVGTDNNNLHASNGICHVNVSGGEIGPLDGTGLNAYVFGGGNGFAFDPDELRKMYANVDSTFVTVSGGHIYGSVFGGGNDAHTLGSTQVTVSTGANIGVDGLTTWDGNIFGGGRNFLNSNSTNGRVAGNIVITMTGGTMQGSIFGGGRMALSGVNEEGKFPSSGWDPTKHGNVTINVSGGSIGNTNDYDLLTGSDESVGDIFGSGKGDTKNYIDSLAGRVTNATINIGGNTRIYGAVFGGGEMASLGWWTNSGFINGTGAATITIDGNPEIGTYLELDPTYASDPSEWTIYNTVNGVKKLIHTCTGNVFGGCQGDVDLTNWNEEPNNWPYMGRSRTSTITVNGGKIMGAVFGGPEQGTMDGNTYVNINGGDIGSEVTAPNNSTYLYGGVYGAGYGVDVDEDAEQFSLNGQQAKADTIAGRVYGNALVNVMGGRMVDVYGGANFAYVGDDSNTPNGNCRVNIGRLKHVDTPTPEPTRDSIPEGEATIRGMVFGANNHAGTPYGSASVHVYKTAHTSDPDNFYPDPAPENAEELEYEPHDLENFAIRAVYGGSNLADYTPVAGCNDTVHVYFCEENTIYDVYGGSNAAAVGSSTAGYNTNCCVIIDGGHIYRVFGGGNGEGGIPADIYGSANTYIKGGLIHEVFGGSNTLGNILETNLTVVEGADCKLIVGDGFGSNNESVAVTDVTTTLECGSAGAYATFYGGANLATIYGTVTVNVMGGEYGNLFAGSKGRLADPNADPPIPALSADIKKIPLDSADIRLLPLEHQQAVMDYWIANEDKRGRGGTVTLNIYGGKIDNAFGGSDVLSDIEGRIMVNVIDTVDQCGLELTNVYGAGRYTTYEPDFVDGKPINSPIVNVIHGNVKGRVFGGGQGATATTIANPEVHIGYVAGNHIMDSLKPIYADAEWNSIDFDNAQAIIGDFTGNSGGDVFGGGHEAAIGDNTYHCNTSVTIGKHNTLVRGTVFGGGYGKILAEGEHIHPADSVYGMVYGNDTVRVLAGHIQGHVYGGGAEAPVEGNTYMELTGGTVGNLSIHQTTDNEVHQIDSIIPGLDIPYYHLTGGRVFGGGRGYNPASDAAVAAADTITYSKYTGFGRVKGNTYVHVSDTAKIRNCVYGGGALASVGRGQLNDKNSGIATVVVSGGEIGPLDGTGLNAYVYGGGRGEEDDVNEHFSDYANVDSTSVIVCDSARIYGSIFGGGADGHVLGDATVQVKKSLANNPTHSKIPVVGTNGKTSWDGNIFGGGRNYRFSNFTAGRVGGNIQVDMSDGLLKGNVYGGGRMGLTGMDADGEPISGDEHGLVTINISGGTIGSPCDTLTIGNVFGGGKGGVEYYVEGVSYPNMILGHAKYGRVKETKVNITGDARVYGSVFGGGEIGKIMGNTTVKVSGGLIGSELSLDDDSDRVRYHGSVYGGGRGYEGEYSLTLPGTGEVVGNSMVNIEGGQVLENVYGGGEIASVVGNAHVNISGGQIGVEQQGQAEVVGGNVFGGALGRPGNAYINHANVDSTFVNISGNAYIVSSVFGGGNDGHVLKSTSVNMTGGTVGKRITLAEMITDSLEATYTHLYTGSVLGGGRGITPVDDAGNFDSEDITGRVYGNTHVTIKGGTVRHAVYGGGGLSSVGTYTLGEDGLPVFTAGTGKTYVTIDSVALIGPTKQDMTWPSTDSELDKAAQYLSTSFNMPGDSAKYVDATFRYLGGNEGWAFGAGCGLAGQPNLTYCDSAFLNVRGNAQIVGSAFGGGENGHVKSATKVNISGGTIGAFPLHDIGEYTVPDGVYKDVIVHLAEKESELAEDKYGAGRRVFRGEVFGGGKGTDTITDASTLYTYSPTAGRVYGNTNVTISDSAVIYNRVYGGGSLASVGTFTYYKNTSDMPANLPLGAQIQRIKYDSINETIIGIAKVTVDGGTIGSRTTTKYLNSGDVVGGGRGIAGNPRHSDELVAVDDADQVVRLAYVGGTSVNIKAGTQKYPTHIVNNVYGGSINGNVYGDTYVKVEGGTIGDTIPNDNTTGYRTRGGWHSNVIGGGGGSGSYVLPNGKKHLSITSGRVYGHSNVEITGGRVLHNVYGGGAIASVGTYDLRSSSSTHIIPNTGFSTVKITGNQTVIGYDGKENGMVYGSGRGEIDSIGAYMDSLSYVVRTYVTIGKDGDAGPWVKGSVYGSGENGHVYDSAVVNVHSGTVGCKLDEYLAMDDQTVTEFFPYRGNVYGGGCGTDEYKNKQNQDRYNPTSGVVTGNTKVTITGGLISHNVYGGGAMGNVGISHTGNNEANAGHTNIIISGGQVGLEQAVQSRGHEVGGGSVFGGSRGAMLDTLQQHPEWSRLANVNQTDVTVKGTAKILSSVYGGSQMGRVFGNANVTIQENAAVGVGGNESLARYRGNVYGGGSGNDSLVINDIVVRNQRAGQVCGNTRIEMTGGNVYGNLFGGCEITDVGTYNYTGANGPVCTSGGVATVIKRGGQVGWKRNFDDIKNHPYYGYVYGGGMGDLRTEFNTWTNVDSTYVEIGVNSDTIWGSVLGGGDEGHVMRHTHVVVKGGVIGRYGSTHYDGNVFGAGRGRTPEALTAGSIGGNTRIDIEDGRIMGSVFGGGNLGTVGLYFVPTGHDLYGVMQDGTEHGYTQVNITGGTIGHEVQDDVTDDEFKTGGNVYGGGRGMAGAPNTIYQLVGKVKQTMVNIRESDSTQTFIMGSVFGSGEDGHVVQDTYVNVYGGQIGGVSYSANPSSCSDMYHGNVYGGGRGLDTYENEQHQQVHSITAGIVSGNTNVNIYGGRILRNVYGGGNLSSIGVGDEPADSQGDYHTGLATVNVLGGTIGTMENEDDYHGNVFGGGHGGTGGEYINLAYVKNTHVTIDSVARVLGSVFGGGEDGHVRMNTLVDMKGGIVGKNEDHDLLHGNVYGGGRGLIVGNTVSQTAGEVFGHSIVNLMQSERKNASNEYYTPEIYNNVYGGGSRSMVGEYKVVNVSAGLVHDDVFGGSREIPEGRINNAPRWVNMWGGTVEGDVYGCSYKSTDGHASDANDWASFINMSGGTVGRNVYGAGFGGTVSGSVAVLIGKQAIESMYTSVNTHRPETVVKNALDIQGSVFAGANYDTVAHNTHTWGDYGVTDHSNIYIDGHGYDTEHAKADANSATKPYMNIGSGTNGGGIYGSGTHFEAGQVSHDILVRNYGARNITSGELTTATRSLTTIQRGGLVVLDSVNVNLKGATDISNTENTKKYGALKIDEGLYVTNASGLVLGEEDDPVLIDSVKQVRSLWLKDDVNMYAQLTSGNESNWDVVGLRKDDATGAYNTLYRIDGTTGGTALTSLQENVIIYNDTSKLMVRYHDKKEGDASYKQYYGELQGFFRMRGDAYDPHTIMKSFAYARPKITDNRSNDNTADGGFLSYDNKFNFFTDNGADYTKTRQYPYLNVLEYSKGDRTDYRMWVAQPLRDTCWYVDGTRGWGHDILKTVDYQVGRFPDKPKKTLFGKTNGIKSGVISEEYDDTEHAHLNFSYEDDLIYVVGALSAEDEKYILRDSIIDTHTYPLLLYRYPGGHKMSNGEDDYGGGKPTTQTVAEADDWGVQAQGDLAHAGPGANYGAMLDVQAGQTATLRGVVMDGLYGYTTQEVDTFNIPTATHQPTWHDSTYFRQTEVNRPMILTHNGSTLNVGGGTILKRGYNNTDAYDWYTNADYTPYDAQGVLTTYQGAAIFVDSLATVNLSGLDSIVGNKQKMDTDVIESNVYLPTFDKHVNITAVLDNDARIGITSPKRNKAANYVYNTFSPVAVANHPANALAAWNNNNFQDDQQWFFVNGYTPAVGDSPSNGRSTYYANSNTIPDYPANETGFDPEKTLFFGWTWANVVRKAPADFAYDNINSPEDLAWLISKSAGMNGERAIDFSTVGTIQQMADIDLVQYVWVPIGDSLSGSGRKPFAGIYDGRAHLIKNLSIQYIGTGDRRYERLNYGMFGYLKGGKLNRTFVVSGKVKPTIPSTSANTYNLGGLVGCLANDGAATAMVSNSEAAVDIEFPSMENGPTIVAGGLVATMESGEIHSSMSMPNVNSIIANNNGAVGGLVGSATLGTIRNSFTNAHFGVTYTENPSIKIGGLLGRNIGAKMSNCYMALRNPEGMDLRSSYFGKIAAVNGTAANIDSCYAMIYGSGLPYVISNRDNCGAYCGDYTPVITADNLGYMYYDNRVQFTVEASGNSQTVVMKEALYKELNRWVTENGSGSKYAYWSRPALSEINGDLPVLLINNQDGAVRYQGDLTSLGTYEGGPALQYGGNVRDDYQLHIMLDRAESIFVYGDVSEDLSSSSVAASKVSIHEDVAILQPWHVSYDNTYVGISFDNSHKNGIASSSAGINHLGMFDLPRDWHMLSTPLSNAPLGFNYMLGNVNTNETGWTSGNHGNYYNNPWAYYHSQDESVNYEFSWLNGGTPSNPTTGPVRYWMKGWENSRSQYNNLSAATGNDWVDGYFPSRVANAAENVTGFAYGEGCMANTDEYGRYPYGMDFFCWYEPEPHWINFKRNGPNHWHSDETPGGNQLHEHLAYTENGVSNKNEDNLVVGKGYMMAICDTTFMQSHGILNHDDLTRNVTAVASTAAGAPYIGWNLVGNPYHAYLDFDKFADFESYDPEYPTTPTVNGILTSYEEGKTPFYVIYDADQYVKDNGASSAYIVYPATGSDGGAYAGRYLHPHQGFFIRAKETGTLTFKEDMTVTRSSLNATNDGHFRGDNRINYPLVNLFLSSDKGCADVTVVELERPRLGGAHKMHELRSGNGLFYARLEDNDYAAVFAPEGTERVPIWFEPTEDDIFTISWNTANANFSSLYLVDNLTGVKYDMLRSDRYIFEAHKFDYKSRFYITFSLDEDPEDEPLEGQEVFVFHDGSQWVVTGEGDLEFVDVLGHVLMRTHITGGQSRVTTPRVANGLYFMRLTNGTECKLQKVIVNNQ